ncbi:MAG: LPXTG cell wall anchor domain-containing protein [Actinomycetota bacterium]
MLLALTSVLAVLLWAAAPAMAGGNGKADAPGQQKKAAAEQSQGDSNGGKDKVVSGESGQPQPPSNADMNPGGANNGGDCDPYCSTRDGTPSGNGQGKNGIEAGSKGRADNKTPPGQQPGPEDRNNGYECDGNNGIAKGNPAHTGCTTSGGGENPPPPPGGGENPPPPPPPGGGENPPPPPGGEQPGGQQPPSEQPPSETKVLSNKVTAPQTAPKVAPKAAPETAVLGTKITAAESAWTGWDDILPRTGSGVLEAVLAGVLLLLAGAATLLVTRRRRAS